jgi:hypothetical protein
MHHLRVTGITSHGDLTDDNRPPRATRLVEKLIGWDKFDKRH